MFNGPTSEANLDQVSEFTDSCGSYIHASYFLNFIPPWPKLRQFNKLYNKCDFFTQTTKWSLRVQADFLPAPAVYYVNEATAWSWSGRNVIWPRIRGSVPGEQMLYRRWENICISPYHTDTQRLMPSATNFGSRFFPGEFLRRSLLSERPNIINLRWAGVRGGLRRHVPVVTVPCGVQPPHQKGIPLHQSDFKGWRSQQMWGWANRYYVMAYGWN